MAVCVIIRGPAGVGKTTIAKELSNHLNADYISFDEILEKNELDTIIGDGIPSKNFIQANKIILPNIKKTLKQGKNVVLDGCFYRKSQYEHLKNEIENLIIFTLSSSLEICQERNNIRGGRMSPEAIKDVFNLV
ncbi:MAG: AAA family ATPase, partial [Nanoarchaeota archaeon]|nr:AAA family ATPase [Nanoarchaeota archaeon]